MHNALFAMRHLAECLVSVRAFKHGRYEIARLRLRSALPSAFGPRTGGCGSQALPPWLPRHRGVFVSP